MTVIRDSHVEIEWAGEKRVFRLRIGEIRALQEATDCGPKYLYDRIANGQYFIDEVRETLRQGLIGGGMAMADADKLLRINFDDKPIQEHVQFAQLVLAAVLIGNPRVVDAPEKVEKPKKKSPAPRKNAPKAAARKTKTTSRSTSSSAMPAKSASARAKSTTSRSGNGSRSTTPTRAKSN